MRNALFILYFYHMFLSSVFILYDISDLKNIKSRIHNTCEYMKTDCEIDCHAGGAPAKILPRAPNYSGPAVMHLTGSDWSPRTGS